MQQRNSVYFLYDKVIIWLLLRKAKKNVHDKKNLVLCHDELLRVLVKLLVEKDKFGVFLNQQFIFFKEDRLNEVQETEKTICYLISLKKKRRANLFYLFISEIITKEYI